MAQAIGPAALFGALVGSFLNVVAWRLPRGESPIRPRSRCPHCGHGIRARDNVPVLSWLLLRGRCRDCRAPIPVRYPLVEATTAALAAVVVAAKWGDSLELALGLTLVLFMVPIALIDYDVQRIPNKLVAPMAALGLGFGIALDVGFVPEQLIAGAAAGAFFLAAALLKPGGMGMGDVKLVVAMGILLGRAVAPAIFAALLLGVLAGAVLSARLGVDAARKTKVPFGVFLAAGALVGLFAGEPIVTGYLDRV